MRSYIVYVPLDGKHMEIVLLAIFKSRHTSRTFPCCMRRELPEEGEEVPRDLTRGLYSSCVYVLSKKSSYAHFQLSQLAL